MSDHDVTIGATFRLALAILDTPAPAWAPAAVVKAGLAGADWDGGDPAGARLFALSAAYVTDTGQGLPGWILEANPTQTATLEAGRLYVVQAVLETGGARLPVDPVTIRARATAAPP